MELVAHLDDRCCLFTCLARSHRNQDKRVALLIVSETFDEVSRSRLAAIEVKHEAMSNAVLYADLSLTAQVGKAPGQGILSAARPSQRGLKSTAV